MEYFDYLAKTEKQSAGEFTVLAQFTDNDWKTLVKFAQTTSFIPDEMLLHAGETDNGVFILISGRVEVILKSRFGKQKIIADVNHVITQQYIFTLFYRFYT